MEVLLNISVILVFGLLGSSLAKIFKFPNVIGYIVAGVLIGPFGFNFINSNDLQNLDILSTIAMALISFLIGSELRIKYIKKLGKKPFIISIIISLTTFIIVSLGLYLISNSLGLSLILGSIASATAPPTILMVLKEYHAKGKLTDHILSVMAIDDIVSLILFGFSLVIAKNINMGVINLNGLLEPFIEIFISILIGISSGLIIGKMSKRLSKENNLLICTLVFIFIPIVICDYLKISPFLSMIITGFTYVNFFKDRSTHKLVDTVDYISLPFLLIFFVVSGVSIDFSLLPIIGFIGIMYMLLRITGKIVGGYIGGTLVKSDHSIKKNLGCSLLSQTGLAVGLATTTLLVLPNEGQIIVAIVIISSFVFDFITPFILKNRLKNLKEIK